MDQTRAIRLAIDLVRVPSRVRVVRSEPLPAGIPLLLRIAAGDDEAALSAAEPSGRTPAFVREAATFFIEQILLDPDADSYRVLGGDTQCSPGELRRNMALLMRWLHPDVAGTDERSVFAGRVTAAWDDLKTAERRAAYNVAIRTNTGRHEPYGPGKRRQRKTPNSPLLLVPAVKHPAPSSSFRSTLRRWLGRPW